jgi:hypothetical protein
MLIGRELLERLGRDGRSFSYLSTIIRPANRQYHRQRIVSAHCVPAIRCLTDLARQFGVNR